MTEDEAAASFSFLTVDESIEDQGFVRNQRKRIGSARGDSQSSKVFVWGLNDYHQLGTGLSESKVCVYV